MTLGAFDFLSAFVQLFVILLIGTTGYMIQPILIGQVPVDSQVYPFLELQAGLPSQFFLDFGCIYRIAMVMAGRSIR